MSMPEEPEGGGGGFLSQKFLGLPALVWVGIAAILAYLYFAHKSSSSSGAAAGPGASSSQGTGNTDNLTTGQTTINPGAVTVSVNAGGSGDTGLAGSATGSPTITTAPNNTGTVTANNATASPQGTAAPANSGSVTTQATSTTSSPSVVNNPQPSPPQPPVSVVTATPQPPAATPAPAPATPQPTYVTVATWTPSNTPWNSTLSGIAAAAGTTVARLLQLNPSITNPNLIYPGQRVRTS